MSKAKILLVDDEPEIVRMLTMRLKAQDYDVISAMDGMQATSMAMREKPDLILLDLGLPAGNGHIVTQRIRENTVTMHVPIIILSARTADDDRLQALTNGADRYIVKPYKAEELIATIESCLQGA
ncbi:MAG: response regulator transcription factor [bacterium]|nr:response regulator transcription factor [bacterium]